MASLGLPSPGIVPSRSIVSGDDAKGTWAEGCRSMRHAKSLRSPPLGALSRSRPFRHTAASPPVTGATTARSMRAADPWRTANSHVCVINTDYLNEGALLAAVNGIAPGWPASPTM
jgi:hypothetical protein